MKEITLFLAALVAGSVGYIINVPKVQPAIMRSLNWTHLQKRIMPLFEEVCVVNSNTIIQSLAHEFLSTTEEEYSRPNVMTNLQNLRDVKGMLPKGGIFTEFNEVYFDELRIVSNVMIYAKTFDTFLKAAAWAKINCNCGLYVDALYLAMIYRQDLEKLSIPAPYELMPNYFIHKDDMMKAAYLLTTGETTFENVRHEDNAYILDTEYTSGLTDDNVETKMTYFHEDIGLNSYYLLTRLRNVPWLNALDNRYGEYVYQFMKQLSARYDLERYSNNLPELEDINWETYAPEMYNPDLIYINGTNFESRISTVDVNNVKVQNLQNIERDIASVVTHLLHSGYNRTQIVNHIMEILVTKDNSYESLAREILGSATANGNLSALDHYMTTVRDPAFWILNKKIVTIIDNVLKSIPSYTRSELYFPGVQIISVDVKKVMTSIDYFEFDVTDAFDTTTNGANYRVKIGQNRLNNKAFTIKTTINSLVAKQGLLKIFLGPQLLPGELAAKKNSFMLLDSFEMNLKVGSNVVSRSSAEMTSLSGDFISLDELRRKVEDAEFGIDALPLKSVMSQTGFPSRLILPKGAPEGLPFQLFVFVAPFEKTSIIDGKLNIQLNDATQSPGYPLDLEIENNQLLQLRNAITKEILITHKPESKPSSYGGNSANKDWNTYGNSEPEYAYPRRDPYMQGQYGKQDNVSKGGNFNKKYDQYKTSTTENSLVIPLTVKNDISSDMLFPSTNDMRPVLRLVSSKPYETDKTSEVANDIRGFEPIKSTDVEFSSEHTSTNKIPEEVINNKALNIAVQDDSIIDKANTPPLLKLISSKYKDFVKTKYNKSEDKITDNVNSKENIKSKNKNISLKDDDKMVPSVSKDVIKDYLDNNAYYKKNRTSEVIIHITDSKPKTLDENSTIIKDIIKDVNSRVLGEDEPFDITIHVTDTDRKYKDKIINLDDMQETLKETEETVHEIPFIKDDYNNSPVDRNVINVQNNIPAVSTLLSSKYKDFDKTNYKKEYEAKDKDKNIVSEDNTKLPTVNSNVTKKFEEQSYLDKNDRTSEVAINDLKRKNLNENVNNSGYSSINKELDYTKFVHDEDEPIDITVHVNDLDTKRADDIFFEDKQDRISSKNIEIIYEVPYLPFEKPHFPVLLEVNNRVPSVYDYIVHPKDDYDDEEDRRVYE